MGRKSFIFSNLDTDWTELEVFGWPDNFYITGVKVVPISGAATQYALRIASRSETSTFADSKLEYTLVSELDYEEHFPLSCYKQKDTDFGSIFVSAKVNTGTNTKIKVIINYAR